MGLVRCLTLDRDAFVKLIGTQATRKYDDHKLSTSSAGSGDPMTPVTPLTPNLLLHSHCLPCFSDVRLSDLKVLDYILNVQLHYPAISSQLERWV